MAQLAMAIKNLSKLAPFSGGLKFAIQISPLLNFTISKLNFSLSESDLQSVGNSSVSSASVSVGSQTLNTSISSTQSASGLPPPSIKGPSAPVAIQVTRITRLYDTFC